MLRMLLIPFPRGLKLLYTPIWPCRFSKNLCPLCLSSPFFTQHFYLIISFIIKIERHSTPAKFSDLGKFDSLSPSPPMFVTHRQTPNIPAEKKKKKKKLAREWSEILLAVCSTSRGKRYENRIHM